MGIAEIVVVIAVLILVAAANCLPGLGSGLAKGVDEFWKAAEEIGGETSSSEIRPSKRVALWLAQGFGVGKIPFAPGTFGSIVGLLWFYILLLPKNPLVFVVGIFLSVFISVRLCGAGEKILSQRDPGSIVMDEIIAIPICFGSWLAWVYFKNDSWPAPEYFFAGENLWLTLGVFVLFRVFDIAKPWPVAQSQKLPGGWGVTTDDVLAAAYVNVAVWIILIAAR